MPRGRFAPSPTGDLHLGGARTALVAWLAARRDGGDFVLRIEDLDRPRIVPGSAERMMEDLRWLGLRWDAGPYYQSQRIALYDAALERLAADGRLFHCFCSRADVARAARAPHGPSDDGARYPGTCRLAHREDARPSSLRLRVEPEVICFEDVVAGEVCQDVAAAVGDFVVRRADGLYAYQLATVVDDIDMQIQEVVRGEDLLTSTPRQLLLYRSLQTSPPRFAHVPLVLGSDGQRLAKRHGSISIRELRDAGLSAPAVIGRLAASLGLCEPIEALWPDDLIARFGFELISRGSSGSTACKSTAGLDSLLSVVAGRTSGSVVESGDGHQGRV